MDKYRHMDDNQELDDVTRLILELKDLSDDGQEPFEYRASAQPEEETVSDPETDPDEAASLIRSGCVD